MRLPIEPEAYASLLEQGLELQRRYDAVLGSRTWRMQLAVARSLRSASALIRLPADLWRIARCAVPKAEPERLDLPVPPTPLPATKPLVMTLVPWLRVGGAERVVLEIIRGLGGELDFAVLPASAGGGVDPVMRDARAWIFPPPEGGYAERLGAVLAGNPVRCLLISSCPQAYAALPALGAGKQIRVVDIVHNASPEGSLAASAAHDRWIDHHFAAGEMQAEALRQGGVPAGKITVARNGVDCEGRFSPAGAADARVVVRAELGLADGEQLLGWVGRLSEEKGPELFLRTLAQLPSAKGLLIGDGPERFRVEALMRDLGLGDRARVTGFTSRVPELLSACDALLLTSRTEGSPLTILEAMSLGIPVVAADVGGVREAVEDGVTGLLIAERVPAVFADAARRLAGDGVLRKELSENGRRRVVERFSSNQMLDAYRMELRRLGILP